MRVALENTTFHLHKVIRIAGIIRVAGIIRGKADKQQALSANCHGINTEAVLHKTHLAVKV